MLRVLLLKANSTNHVLRIFVDNLSYHLSLIEDVEVIVLDLLAHPKALTIEFCSQFNAVISFNAVGTNFTEVVNGKEVNIFNYLALKHICWMVDDPVYHFTRLLEPNPNRITLFTSELHINTAKDFGFDGRFGQTLVAGSMRDAIKPHTQRIYDIAVAASWMGYPEEFWLNYEESLQEIILAVLNKVKLMPICNAYPILKDELIKRDLWLSEVGLFEYILTDIHSYIRKLDRLNVINELVSSGLSIALIGTGWTTIFQHNDNVFFLENMEYSNIDSIYENSRVVVNFNAENGACERVFDGISQGAMIFSDFSNALNKIFSNKEILFYRNISFEEDVAYLKNIISCQLTESYADKAREIMLTHHIWKDRVSMLCRYLLE